MAGVLILLGWRMLITLAYRVYEVPKRLLLRGTSDLAFDIVTALETRSELSMKVIGFILGSEAASETIPAGLAVLGTVDDLEKLAEEHQINRVVVALPDRRGALPVKALLNLKLHDVEIDDGHSFYEQVTGKVRTTALPPSWIVFSEGFHELTRKVRHKQVIDFVVALIGSIIAAPIAALVAIVVKLDSRGPAL